MSTTTGVWMRARDHFTDSNVRPGLVKRGDAFLVNDEVRAKDFEHLADRVSEKEAAKMQDEHDKRTAQAQTAPLGAKGPDDATEKVVAAAKVGNQAAPAGAASTQPTEKVVAATPASGAKSKGAPENKANPQHRNKSR